MALSFSDACACIMKTDYDYVLIDSRTGLATWPTSAPCICPTWWSTALP